MTGKHAIIGDVHGTLPSLRALVGKLALGARDHLIFVGDVVDKGPQSAETVQYIRHLHEAEPFRVTLIEGNHEDKNRRYNINLRTRPFIAAKMAETTPEMIETHDRLKARDQAYLASAPPFVRIPEWNVLVVHGGITANLKRVPNTPEDAAQLRGKAKDAFRTVLRARYLDQDSGHFVAYGKERPGDPFWAEQYDGRFGHVVFGHQPFIDGPACYPHATGIDTGAVHGGDLTALVLPHEGSAYFVTAPGQQHQPFKAERQPPHPGQNIHL